MGEAVRQAGHRAVKQQNCSDLKTLYAFLDTLPQNPFKCVIKPAQSAGSDDVFLCNDYDEAAVAFNRIVGKRNGLGLINENALAQEYLRGTEYVIDQVSKNGAHKVVTIWQYDKRFVNGAAFVYFGMKLVSCDSALSQELIAYANDCLEALGIMEGPSHMEVMYNPAAPENGGGPCLVEVGSRCHGGEGTWLPLVKEASGYTQVSITVDVYLNGPLFDTISATHAPLRKYAMDCDMVSRAGGIVRSMPGEALVRKYESFRSISWEVHIGEYCPKTIDCFTRPGVVQMINSDPKQLEIDFENYHNLERDGKFIDYSIICPIAPTAGSIVIVDPHNTGSHLAALSLRWGYKLILVFTQHKDGSRSSSHTLLSQYGNHYKPTLMIQHNNGSQSKEEAVRSTIDVLEKQQTSSPILAIIPGANTGVEVAEQLASRFGTRCNGIQSIRQCLDKDKIQRVVAKAPAGELLPVVEQALCRTEADARAFYENIQAKGSEKVVAKPRDGTGDACLMLCQSIDEAVFAFKNIHQQENVLGATHDGALLQEFITGKEYVVDGMSRNGEYKILALWECERRSFNGCDFVPFSMSLKLCSGIEEVAVVNFARQTVAAMGKFSISPCLSWIILLSHFLSSYVISFDLLSFVHVGLQNGPSSVKIMIPKSTNMPLLLECNASCHDQDGSWITLVDECVGYSQVDATLSCFVRPDGYDELPAQVDTMRAEGMEVYLVSSSRGLVRDIVGLQTIRALPSCKRVDMFTQPGAHVIPTCDYYSRVGTVVLVNKDKTQLMQDYNTIRQLELDQKLIKFV